VGGGYGKMKFRKRPVVVEADQWFTGKKVEGVCGDDPNKICGCVMNGSDLGNTPHVHPTRASYGIPLEPGDWVIREQDGSGYYPCKDDVFQQTYEVVEDMAR
jgi:hypothetical protein